MDPEKGTIRRGWWFPEGLNVPEEDAEAWYRIRYGDSTVHGLSWSAHVDLLHQKDAESIETEVVDSGIQTYGDGQGIRYAAVKATVVVDGRTFSSLQAADETTNQVRDPEFVWAVAESRALKRAVKKALNIQPVDEATITATDEDAAASKKEESRRPSGPAPEIGQDEEEQPTREPVDVGVDDDPDVEW